MDNKNFSDEPIDSVQQDFDQWEQPPEFPPPPPAGMYTVYVDQIRAADEFDAQVGKRLTMTLDLRIVGGTMDNRTITWQRMTNAEYTRKSDGKRTSLLLDLIKAAGVQQAPRSNNEFYRAVTSLQDGGPSSSFNVQIDWKGFCTTCYEKSLMNSTQTASADAAKGVATGEDYDKANAAGSKAKNFRAFPINSAGVRKDSFICPDCGNEVRAQVRISRFLTRG